MDYTCAMKCITATSKTAEETTKIPEDTMPNMDIGLKLLKQPKNSSIQCKKEYRECQKALKNTVAIASTLPAAYLKKATFNKECVLNDYQFSSNGDQIYLKPDIKRLKQDNMCDENTMPSIEIEIKPELNDFIVKNEYDEDNGYFMNVTRIKIEQDIQNTLEKEEFSNNKIISNEKVHIVKQNAIFFREQNNMHDNNVISSNEIKTEIKPECNNMNDDEYIADDDYFSSEEIKIDVEKDKHFSGEHNKMNDNMISSEKIEIEIKPKLNDFIVNDDVFNQTSEKSTKKCEYLSLIKEKKFGQSSCMMECIYVTPEASVQKLLIPEDTIPNINSESTSSKGKHSKYTRALNERRQTRKSSKQPPKSAAQRIREFRARQKALRNMVDSTLSVPATCTENNSTCEKQPNLKPSKQSPKQPPKSAAQRVREFRARQKALMNIVPLESSVPTAYLENNSTCETYSKKQHGLKPSKQPLKKTAQRSEEFLARQKALRVMVASTSSIPAASSENNRIFNVYSEKQCGLKSSKQPPKSVAQRVREFRARQKALRNTVVSESSVPSASSENNNTCEMYSKKQFRLKPSKQSSKQPPKSAAQRSKEFRERQKALRITVNSASSVPAVCLENKNMCKIYSEKQRGPKPSRQTPKQPPKSVAQRSREFRARQKALKNMFVSASSVPTFCSLNNSTFESFI